MVDFTVKVLEVVSNPFTVTPIAHEDTLTDTYTSDDTLLSSKVLVNRIADYLYSSDSNTVKLERFITLADVSLFADSLFQAQEESLTDTSLGYDFPEYNLEKIVLLLDVIKSVDINTNHLTSINHLVVIATFQDILENALFDNLSDTVTCSDVLVSVYTHIMQSVDAALFSSTLSGTKYINVYLNDTGLVVDSINNTAELFQYLADSTNWLASLGLGAEDYIAYVMNTQSKAVTQYDNYPFNSMSENLACASDGIYKLSGNDDSGTLIKSIIKTGLMDFDDNRNKQIPYVYIAITSSGDVVLKSVTTYRGTKKEILYRVKTRNNSFANVRAELGRGIKSRYWQFILENIDGSDFELENIEPMPLIMKRRI